MTSEALAGTRIRGLTPTADAELLRDLLSSKKDMLENEITGQFIRNALQELEENGWLEKQGLDESSLESPDYYKNSMMQKNHDRNGNHRGQFFVRRLRHLMHICQTFEGRLSKNANVIGKDATFLVQNYVITC